VNPNSGTVKILLSGGGCTPGSTSIQLPTGDGGGGDGRGPRVVDAADEDVGAYLGGSALRHVAPYWLLIAVGENGFRGAGLDVHYLLPDCAGDPYMQTEEAALARKADLRADGLLHVAGDPIQLLTIQSARDLLPDGSFGSCFNFSFTSFFGPDTSVDPGTFGLTAPFHLVDE